MKQILIGVCGIVLFTLSCLGQTNTGGSAPLGFSLPALRLRAEVQAETEKTAPALALATPSTLSNAAIELESSLRDTEFQSRIIRSGEFYLSRAELPSDSGLVRFVESVFTPEVVHIGKVPVTCSIVTAIKRKNPLCLLNPIFFQMSW